MNPAEFDEQFYIDFMKPEHIDQIHAIEMKSFSDPWSIKLFEDELKNDRATYFVVLTETGSVVGYGGLWKILDEGHIMNVAVDPAYRGRGIGDSILSNMIEYSIKNNMDYLTLEVREGNTPARNLYYKYNFKDGGLRKGYYQDNHENAIIMWRDNKND